MRSSDLGVLLMLPFALSGCFGSGDEVQPAQQGIPNAFLPNGTYLPAMTGPNVMPLSVNGGLCSAGSYQNKPCVSVTICSPGTSNCQTVNDILLDTGSYGLRVFGSVLTVPLTQVTVSGNKSLAECVHFGDGSSDWGPVQLADLKLAGEPTVQVPIHVIDAGFSNPSSICNGAEPSPASAGFNGILGVGMFEQDCGAGCVSNNSNRMYYACQGSNCTGTSVSLGIQVQNPISQLPVDNNGVIVSLPSVPLGGKPSADGYVIFGIGTQTNNQPSNVVLYPASSATGDFTTTLDGELYTSFLDTGSNALYLSAPASVPSCGIYNSQDLSSWYCPASPMSFQAINKGSGGAPIGGVIFQIGNTLSLLVTPNNVFSELAGAGGNMFDWGLPFYLGRNVYLGFEGKSSVIGSGTYWAY